MKKSNRIYEAPELYAASVSTEHGFAGSGFGEANQAGESVRESGDYTYNL